MTKSDDIELPITIKDSTSNDYLFINTTTKTSYNHTVYLLNEITDIQHYLTFLTLLENATENDTITIILNNCGGYISTGTHLIDSIRNSNALVNIKVVANCYSMASMLAITGDNLEINDTSYLMFHDYSGGQYGKGNEMSLQNTASQSQMKLFFKKYLTPFLTNEECTTILQGKDLYIHAEDVRKRWKRVIKNKYIRG